MDCLPLSSSLSSLRSMVCHLWVLQVHHCHAPSLGRIMTALHVQPSRVGLELRIVFLMAMGREVKVKTSLITPPLNMFLFLSQCAIHMNIHVVCFTFIVQLIMLKKDTCTYLTINHNESPQCLKNVAKPINIFSSCHHSHDHYFQIVLDLGYQSAWV